MALESQAAGLAILGARVGFAGVLGYLALGNLLDLGGTVAYAESKGVPVPGVTVPLASLVLLAGATSLLVGVYPSLGVAAVVAFLVVVTPVMHDFWRLEGQDAQNEQVHFAKNVGLLAAALAFLALVSTPWHYAVGPTL